MQWAWVEKKISATEGFVYHEADLMVYKIWGFIVEEITFGINLVTL